MNEDKFALFARDVETLLSKADVPLTGVEDIDGFTVNDKMIWFNGKDDDAHETFVLEQIYKDLYGSENNSGKWFAFCKTAHKPYDKYVVATLVLAKLYFEKDFDISSDGEISEWQEGVNVLNKIFDYDISMPNAESVNESVTSKNFTGRVVDVKDFEEAINHPVYK